MDIARPGIGLYTPAEAAMYTRLRLETFNRWFFDSDRGQPVLEPELPNASPRVVTFRDLIEANAVRTLRQHPKGRRVPLQHIRTILNQCKELGIYHPLAQRHTLYVFGTRLILRMGEGQYVGLDPKIDAGQLYHGKIIEPFLNELEFDEHGMAKNWSPLQRGKYRVILDPDRRFGLPIIDPGGILVRALVDAAIGEGDEELAAQSFGIEPDAVRLAIKYTEHLAPAA